MKALANKIMSLVNDKKSNENGEFLKRKVNHGRIIYTVKVEGFEYDVVVIHEGLSIKSLRVVKDAVNDIYFGDCVFNLKGTGLRSSDICLCLLKIEIEEKKELVS